ncbi:site-2 protease family protein [Zhengella mangrovi]|uniref:Site-2 protease family protein n=1 Tax=Zhengella mangrovi TaxID=1982044 RepID=A0A2G1QHT6_9HYPH|nr:site-2 protease family protein [Zhengella mangrovi]PHP65082.1 site-2 protease family protein [Zhengella mangrovi]
MNTALILFAGVNLAIIFLAIAAPLGVRRFTLTTTVRAPRDKLFQALHPFGRHADWSGQIVSSRPDPDGTGGEISLSWLGRDNQPIRRQVQVVETVPGAAFAETVTDDTSLDASFWRHWRSEVQLRDEPDGSVRVSMTRTDRYRGAAFLVFRWFAARRELIKLKTWAETGVYTPGGLFEHPATQLAMAALSVVILWPIFGLTKLGFMLALALTVVIALHELGHMAAFRLMGHKSARMIFIPVLGGVAIGGRPYDSRFEIAFVALMGAGFSGFLVPIAVYGHEVALSAGNGALAAFLGTVGACAAFFNLANLVPVWKFDGGQVLRQITPETGPARLMASMIILLSVMVFAWLGGFSGRALLIACAVMTLLSLITVNSGVKPRAEMKPISAAERVLITGGLAAALVIHGSGIVWAMHAFF